MLEHFQWCSVCDLAKRIFHIQVLVILLSCNPTHETKTWSANRLETTNSKPPRPIIMMSQSKTLSGSPHHIYYTLCFCRCTPLACLLFTSLHELCSYAEPKPISWAKPAHFDFSFHPILMSRSHVLSTAGNALLWSGICPLQNKQQGVLKTKMEGMLLTEDLSSTKWQDIFEKQNTHFNGHFSFQNAQSLSLSLSLFPITFLIQHPLYILIH